MEKPSHRGSSSPCAPEESHQGLAGRQCCSWDEASQNAVHKQPLTVSQEAGQCAACWTPWDHSVRACISCQQPWSLSCAPGPGGCLALRVQSRSLQRGRGEPECQCSHRWDCHVDTLSWPSCPHMNIVRGSLRQGRMQPSRAHLMSLPDASCDKARGTQAGQCSALSRRVRVGPAQS